MAELKPIERCPFCKEEDALSVESKSSLFGLWHWVFCGGCAARGPAKSSEEDAIDAWNKRS